MSGYTFEQNQTGAKVFAITRVMREALNAGLSGAAVYKRLQDEGASYRKTNVLEDYRRFQAVETSKTQAAYQRATSWYDNTLLPMAKKAGLTSTEMLDRYRKATLELERSDEDQMIIEGMAEGSP